MGVPSQMQKINMIEKYDILANFLVYYDAIKAIIVTLVCARNLNLLLRRMLFVRRNGDVIVPATDPRPLALNAFDIGALMHCHIALICDTLSPRPNNANHILSRTKIKYSS